MTVRMKNTGRGTSGLDLGYRPSSYFWAMDAGIRLASDIAGAKRRADYQSAIEHGVNLAADALISQSVLDQEDRDMIGSIHPSFMGGEYLPRRKAQEVEIARITIASTTQDVTCVYARRTESRIHYRVVDEYGGETLKGATRSSVRPLKLGQLVDFFLSSWDLLSGLDANFDTDGYPRNEVHDFIVDASSSFYAEFESAIRERVDDWLDQKHAQLEEQRDEAGPPSAVAAEAPACAAGSGSSAAPQGQRVQRCPQPPAEKFDGIDPAPNLNCKPGDLAVVLHDEPTCSSNIGHIVRVYGPMAMTKDLGATWLILPVGRRKWAVRNRDGTFRKMVVRLRDRIEHSDAWLMPLRDDDVSGVVEEEALGMDSPAVMRSMQARIDRSLVEVGAIDLPSREKT